MRLKKVKDFFSTGRWCSTRKTVMQEKRLSVDEEHIPYIRGKRKKASLPNTWDTRWLSVKEFRGWKKRVKKKRQWMKHESCDEERKLFDENFVKKKVMKEFCNEKWTPIPGDWEEQVEVHSLVKRGILEGFYIRVRRVNKISVHKKTGEEGCWWNIPFFDKNDYKIKEVVYHEEVLRYVRLAK